MFRKLSIVVAASLLMVGCGGGGGGGGNKSPSSTSVSSMRSSASLVSSSLALSSSSMQVSSSVLSSSSSLLVSSRASTSASSAASVIVLQAANWVANNAADLTLTNEGPNVSLKTEYDGAKYTVAAPAPILEQASFEVDVTVSPEFKASGAGLQLYAFVDASPWPAKNDCPVVTGNNLVVGSQKVVCVLDTGGSFNQTVAPVGLGIQAIAGLQGETKLAVSGTVLITKGRILLSENIGSSSSVSSVKSSQASSASSVATFALPASSWYAKGDGSAKNGDVYTISKPYAGVGYWLNAADAVIEGATVEVDFVVNSDFKTSGVGLKINAGVEAVPYPGKNDCPQLDSAALTPGVMQRISCVLNSGGIFSQTINPVEIRLLSEGVNAANGTLTIQAGRIILAK